MLLLRLSMTWAAMRSSESRDPGTVPLTTMPGGSLAGLVDLHRA
ncbi:MAG: hypothetical protein ACK55Z_11740 [bacterium]